MVVEYIFVVYMEKKQDVSWTLGTTSFCNLIELNEV